MAMLMPADSVDSIVCDPPYGLSKEPDMAEVLTHWLNGDDYEHGGSGFMGKSWDSFVPGPSVWREAYRVLKPGGHLIAFFGTRTYDLGVLALRLAGFEVRDQLAWVFGSGFPKSHSVPIAIDKMSGRPARGKAFNMKGRGERADELDANGREHLPPYEPATDAARQWQGWGTALKPAYEPIVLCRKPLSEPTVAANVLRWGTGALNIDGCRIGDEVRHAAFTSLAPCHGNALGKPGTADARRGTQGEPKEYVGRWPANLAHDGSDEVLAGFPDSKGSGPARKLNRGKRDESDGWGMADEPGDLADAGAGSAARFFYCSKASKSDRNEGLDDLPERASAASDFRPNHTEGAAAGEDGNPYGRWSPVRNVHPTVKPTALMQWLVRMVTPPGGLVLDPFTGSGSTGKAAVREGFSFVGCEMTPEYAEIARLRIDHAVRNR